MSLPAYAMSRASFPEMYEQLLVGPLFRPWVEDLLERVELSPGCRLLDVACGTGIVARVAHEHFGGEVQVVGVDLSPQMLAVAAAVAPTLEWREGAATALPARDGEFHAVLCQQGVQFFQDKLAALREMRRVLAPEGRVAIAVWRAVEESPLLHALNQVAERHLGTVTDQRYSYGDPDVLESLLRDAGFSDIRVETRRRTIRFPDTDTFVRLNAMALVGMSAAASSMDDQQRSRAVATIVEESAVLLPPYTEAGGLFFEIGTNIASARREP
jgi:ubiquinone/menaquinone biosynthesis C-methylase UbiE